MQDRSRWSIGPIRSRRLLLRPWCFADLEAMAAWPPYTDPLDEAANWPRQLAQHGSLDLFFWTRNSDPRRRELVIVRRDAVIGYLGIRAIDSAERSSRLSIGLGAPFVDQGYGTEALAAFIRHYFGTLGFRLLRLEVAAYNMRARHVYERLGFVERGQRWQDDGAAEQYALLAAPHYAAQREHFDIRAGRVYLRMLEMELTRGMKGRNEG